MEQAQQMVVCKEEVLVNGNSKEDLQSLTELSTASLSAENGTGMPLALKNRSAGTHDITLFVQPDDCSVRERPDL